jgi:hypothetical protein
MNVIFGLPGNGPIQRFEEQERRGFLPRGWIDGLILANDTTDATNDISISPGQAKSTVNMVNGAPSTLTRDQIDLDLPASIIKQLDVAWAPAVLDGSGIVSNGAPSGGRSGSSLSDTTWHVYLIGGRGLACDILLHDSATQSSVLAALPGGYTAYRRIGSIIRSTTILGFVQRGNRFDLNDTVLDYNQTAPGTSALTVSLTVPTGISVLAHLGLSLVNAAGSEVHALLSSLDVTDESPGTANGDVVNGGPSTTATGQSPKSVYTNTSRQIRARLTASPNVTLQIRTRGWTDLLSRTA